jgi:hypothetical protein
MPQSTQAMESLIIDNPRHATTATKKLKPCKPYSEAILAMRILAIGYPSYALFQFQKKILFLHYSHKKTYSYQTIVMETFVSEMGRHVSFAQWNLLFSITM